jgi:hypothetical protein
MFALQVKTVLLLDVLQLLILFVGMLTYLEPKRFLLIIYHNGTFNYKNINCIQEECFFYRIMAGVIVLMELLLLSQ